MVANPHLDLGQGNVSRLCHEPKVALAVLYHMMAYAETRGDLQIHLNRKSISVEIKSDQIEAVTFMQTVNGETETVAADFVLDATEIGDLLPLGRVEYMSVVLSLKQKRANHMLSRTNRNPIMIMSKD